MGANLPFPPGRSRRCWQYFKTSRRRPHQEAPFRGTADEKGQAMQGGPSGYGISGRCSADAPSVPPPDGSAPLTDAASGVTPDRLRARRKPSSFERFVGSFVLRIADRQYAASCSNCRHGSRGASPLWHPADR